MKKKKSNNKFINIALPIKINSTFLYQIPDGMDIEDILYKRVMVNFNGRLLRGYAISEGEYTDKFEVKEILKILDKQIVIKNKMIDFAKWLSSYYFAGLGEVLSIMIPKGLKSADEEEKINFIPKKNKLTDLQENIYNNINNDIKKGVKKFYLYGITGSGKTEIYIKIIEDILEKGQSVIFLVPEITLSYQTLERLKERFGLLCAVLHSNLKGSIRFREYLRLFNNKAKIAIGPRSALFAPLDNIGLIIIDEENESSYKSEESPRYHARTAAQFLVQKNNSLLILGSATPSIESWYFAKKDFIKLYILNERYGGALLPEINIIDNSKQKTNTNLTLPMIQEINERLKKKEQVVLLQNRRGFANFIKCKKCQFILKCPRCDMSLTYHKSKNICICHHCGYHINLPDNCPLCKEKSLLRIGAGTQRIEDEISTTFSFAKVKRMDYDSLKNEYDLLKLFKDIEDGNIDILVGTQMIAKGLHFPKIKFVGIVNADILLNIPDFKSAERTFSLITQVAGRAGRVGEKGSVMIQTMNPDHYAIIAAKNSNFEEFYEKEIKFRKVLEMPPFKRLLRLVIRGKNEEKTIDDINKLSEIFKKNKDKNVTILGPAPCLMTKINNNYRYQILLKSKNIKLLQDIVKNVLNNFNLKNRNYLEIDVDPVDLF